VGTGRQPLAVGCLDAAASILTAVDHGVCPARGGSCCLSASRGDASQAAISRRYRRARRRDITTRPWAGPWRGATSALAGQRMRRSRYRGDITVSDGAISRRGLQLAGSAVPLLP
jgi:hypothetical protein